MPNYCDSCFKVTGDDESLVMKFYMDMAKACGGFGGLSKEERTYKDSEGNDAVTGDDWYGNFYLAAGYTMKEIDDRGMHARGWDTEVELETVKGKPCVKITACMAWSPAIDEMYQMINEKYGGGLTAYAWAEEGGNGIYINTDSTGDYFPERYIIDYWDKDDSGDRLYYNVDQEEEFVGMIEHLTGKKWLNAAEILGHGEEVHDAFCEKNPGDNCYLVFDEFTSY